MTTLELDKNSNMIIAAIAGAQLVLNARVEMEPFALRQLAHSVMHEARTRFPAQACKNASCARRQLWLRRSRMLSG